MTHDTLIISGLVAQARLGVTGQERESPQQIWIDATLSIDAAKAALRDDVRDAVDYGELVSRLQQHVAGKPVKLLETLAEELAALILKDFAVPRVTLRVKKRALPGMDYAAVEVTRP